MVKWVDEWGVEGGGDEFPARSAPAAGRRFVGCAGPAERCALRSAGRRGAGVLSGRSAGRRGERRVAGAPRGGMRTGARSVLARA